MRSLAMRDVVSLREPGRGLQGRRTAPEADEVGVAGFGDGEKLHKQERTESDMVTDTGARAVRERASHIIVGGEPATNGPDSLPVFGKVALQQTTHLR